MNKIDYLYEIYVNKKEDFTEVEPDINYGYMNFKDDSIEEFSNWIKRFMKRFGIGTKISRKFWGNKKQDELQKTLYDNVEKDEYDQISLKTKPSKLWKNLQTDVRSKSKSRQDYIRIARTEAANIKAVFQLKEFQDLGIEKVRHKNNAGSIRRKTVSTKCKQLNNRVLKIDYLLSKSGEKDRISIHPNCMCRYEPVIDYGK